MFNILTKTTLALGAALTFAFAGCSGKGDSIVKGTLVTHNDFEAVLGWGGSGEPSVTNQQAHSGKWAIKVGPDSEYGYTYIQKLGNMSSARVKTLTVSAWVWLPSEQVPSSMVLSISHSPERDTPVFYGTINLAKETKKFKSWQQISQTFTLPDSVQSINLVKCYLWRVGSAQNVYADDITISVEN